MSVHSLVNGLRGVARSVPGLRQLIRSYYRGKGDLLALAHRYDRKLCRRLWSYDNEFSRHIRAYAELTRARLSYGMPSQSALVDMSSFWKDGHARLPDHYPPALVDTIRARFNTAALNPDNLEATPPADGRGNYYRWSFRNVDEVVPEVAALVTPEVIRSVEACYGSHCRIIQVSCTRTIGIPAEIRGEKEWISNHWHCDNRKYTIIKLFYLVDDTTEADGPFHIQPRRRTRELYARGFRDRADYVIPVEIMEDPAHVLRFTGRAGAAMLCNTELCLHRAGVGEVGHRRHLVEIKFMPANAPLPKHWADDKSLFVINIGNVGR